ncbi:MAG: SLC13 family permease [Kocuria sp.]|nr:SLC13 family permease [Kocuria sp.]
MMKDVDPTPQSQWSTVPLRLHDREVKKGWVSYQRIPFLISLALLSIFAFWCFWAVSNSGLNSSGALTLVVFASAVFLWIFSRLDDTYIALGAAILLIAMGVIDDVELFSSLGEDTIWLILSAFIIAAGVTASGLAARIAGYVMTGATSIHQLLHLVTLFLVVTAFAVPSTSGRAALTLPIFLALAAVFREQQRVVLAFSLLFPSVILLSAVGSYLGAGAHLITSQILSSAGQSSFDVASWLILGLPLALVSSHISAEIIIRMFTAKNDRKLPVKITLDDLQRNISVPISGPLTTAQTRSALLVAVVVILWCSESLHGLNPAVVGLIGALLTANPRWGAVNLSKALKSVPWSLLVFMASTLTLGAGLVNSGAADWLARQILSSVLIAGDVAPKLFVVLVVIISTAAHLVIQSRSARSAVLIPIIIALSPGVGVDPTAAAFASTAAAGFCHTLTSSAKPVAIFSDIKNVSTFRQKDLLRLSIVLGPTNAILVILFSFLIWPLLGMPLFL